MDNPASTNISPKKRTIAAILCFFLGSLGVHRFWVGKTGSGVGMLVTLGAFGIWTLVDFIMICMGKFTDKEGRVLEEW